MNKSFTSPLWSLFGAALLVCAVPSGVLAQSAGATLRGAAPPNATVTARNTATGITRRAVVDANGRYTLIGLPPGTYEIDAGSVRQTVQLAIASTVELNLADAASGANTEPELETVIVSGRRLVEVRTSAVGGGVSQRQIETTPQVTRNFLEFADTVPGMSFDVDSKGNTTVRSGPQGPGATNVFIDGVGQKNYVRASGITGQAGASASQNPVGTPGNPFPQLAIGEYKVITSNYGAEYDQISGAAITAVTRSGTNAFKSEAFYTFTDGSLRELTPAEAASAARRKQGGPSKEYGFAVGGPIIQDRMHYFLTYEGKDFTSPNTVFAPQLVDDNGNNLDAVSWLPAALRANYGPVANPFKEHLVFGKLDWELTDNDRFELSTKYRRERQQAGSQGTVAASAASIYGNDEVRVQLGWDRTAGSFFNEMKLTYEDAKDKPAKAGDKPGNWYIASGTAANGFDPILQTDGLRPRDYFAASQKGLGVQNDLTFNALNWHGEHTIKTGVKFKSVKLLSRDAVTAPFYSYYVSANRGDGQPGVDATPFQVEFGAQADANLPTVSTSKNRQYGIYLQDDWTLNEHWKFNIGVRYDYEQTPTFTNYVTPARFVRALTSLDPNTDPDYYTLPNGRFIGAAPGQTYDQSLANGGINIFDYISTGSNRKNRGNQIQPRLGVSWDLTGEQRHVLFAGAGRSYDRNVFDILQHESNKATLIVPTVQFFNSKNPGCSGPAAASATCIPFNASYLTEAGLRTITPSSFGEMHLINNNVKSPYSDQFSVGMRNRLGDWNTSVTVTRVLSRDGLIARPGNRFGDGSWWWWDSGWWAGTGGPYGGYPANSDGQGSLWLFDNGKSTRNTQVLLSLEKPYTVESGWAANIAYTRSNARGRLIGNGHYQTEWPDHSGAQDLASTDVGKHRFVAVANMDGPWGLVFGGKLVLETPRAFTGYTYALPPPPDGKVEQYTYFSLRNKQKDLGFTTFDFQVTKNFSVLGDGIVQVRLDVLNALNRRNYSQYNYDAPYDLTYAKDGNINGVPRTLKLGLNVKF